MKRRTLKKQIAELAEQLCKPTRKYLEAGSRVHQDILYRYEREIEYRIFALMRLHLVLDPVWPHRRRWLDGLSEEFSWEGKKNVLRGYGELFWGHWPEVGWEITVCALQQRLNFVGVMEWSTFSATEMALTSGAIAVGAGVRLGYNKRLERTRRERASLVGCVGEPLKRNAMHQ